MGAGQIGGIATLLDIDFANTAGFVGTNAQNTEAQFIVYFLSHAMMFCAGAMLEGHVVLTTASCVYSERFKFEVFGATHLFYEHTGVPRVVQHVCTHRGFNYSERWSECQREHDIAILVLQNQFSFHSREPKSDFVMNRIRYGSAQKNIVSGSVCSFYGWGSRRNGFLIPLLIHLRRVDITILEQERCDPVWQSEGKFICAQQLICRSDKFGALCPDDVGTVLVCSGFAQGLMVSHLMDRPCGTGFLDLTQFTKFLTCAIDGSRDVINQDDNSIDFSTETPPSPAIATPPDMESDENEQENTQKPDKKLEEGEEKEEREEKEEKEEKEKEEKIKETEEIEEKEEKKDKKKDKEKKQKRRKKLDAKRMRKRKRKN